MDRETEREIWKRVQSGGQIGSEEALLDERLEKTILAAKQSAADLRRVAARLNPSQRGKFLRMAAQSENSEEELTAIHYLLTGRRLKLHPKPGRLPQELPEALRAIWMQIRDLSRDYAALSRDFSDYADSFEQMRKRNDSFLPQIGQALGGRLR